MKQAYLSTGQLGELINLDRTRGGISTEVQSFIETVSSGSRCSNTNERLRQAIVRWHPEYMPKHRDFWDFLEEVPPVPTPTGEEQGALPCLVLPDLPLATLCKIARVSPEKPIEEYVDLQDRRTPSTSYWMFVQLLPPAVKAVCDARRALLPHQMHFTFREALSFRILNSVVHPDLHLCLTNVVVRNCKIPDQAKAACFERADNGSRLSWHYETVDHSSAFYVRVR